MYTNTVVHGINMYVDSMPFFFFKKTTQTHLFKEYTVNFEKWACFFIWHNV